MPAALFEDIVYDIARYVRQDDLRSLALASRSCRGPAHKELFCVVTIRPTPNSAEWLHKFIDLVTDDFLLPKYIHSVILRGTQYAQTATCDLYMICTLLKHLPVLKKLTLDSLRWRRNPRPASVIKPHDTLDGLHVHQVYAGRDGSSPLELLFCAKSWITVNISNVIHHATMLPLTSSTSTVPVSKLVLKQDAFMADIGDMPCPAREVVMLRVEYIDEEHTALVERIIRNSSQTLQFLLLNLNPLNACGPMELWARLFIALGQCEKLTTLSICLPIFPCVPYPIYHPGFHMVVAQQIFTSLPRNIRFVNVVMELGYNPSTISDTETKLLDWFTMGKIFRSCPTLDVVQLRLVSIRKILVQWELADLIALRIAFPQYSVIRMNATRDTVMLSGAQYTSDQLLSLMSYRPLRSSDQPPF